MISTAELAQKEFTGITLPEPYGNMLGKIPMDASMAIWGPKGSGKSTMAVDFAWVLANEVGKGIYCSSEEGPGPSMQNKINRLDAEHNDLMVTDYEGLEDLKAAVKYSSAKFVILDSASMGYVKLSEFEAFHDWCKEQDVMLIYILHANKEGNYKGNTMMVHMPDVEIKVADGMAVTEKNRFEETPREMEVVFERGNREKADGKRKTANVKRSNPDESDNRYDNRVIVEHFKREAGRNASFDYFKKWIKENYPERTVDAKKIWDTPKYGYDRPVAKEDRENPTSHIVQQFSDWAYNKREITPRPVTLKTWLSRNYPELEDQHDEIWESFIRNNPQTDTQCLVSAKAQTNEEKNGIEIQFSDAPPEWVREQLKENDFTFYNPNDGDSFWAAPKTAKRKKAIESIAGEFDTAVVGWKTKDETSNDESHSAERVTDTEKFLGYKEKRLNEIENISDPQKRIANARELREEQIEFLDEKRSEGNAPVINEQKISKIIVDAEKELVSEQPKEIPEYLLGNETTVDFKADGSIQEQGHFAVMDVSDIIPSHNKDCSPNSAHKISKGQPRDRSIDALCQQPKFIAQNLNPTSITRGNLAFNGASTMLPDGQVIQGNGRGIALKIAVDEHKENYQQYKDYLSDNASDWGLTKEQISKFDKPALVRILDVSDDRAIELGNVVDTSQAKMSQIDQGKAHIRNLPKEKKQVIGNLIDKSSGETIGQVIDDVGLRILDQIKGLDRQGLVEDNSLTAQGKDFLRSVFAGLVFDSDENKDALQHFLNLKHRQQAGIKRSYGNIIPFIETEADITPTLQKAVEIAAKVQQKDGIDTVRDFIGQSDAFSGANTQKFSKEDAALAEFLLDADTQKFIRNGFRMYQWKVNGKEDLFNPVEEVSPDQAFEDAFIERIRINPDESLIYIGVTECIHVENGSGTKALEGEFPTFLSENKLYIVPQYRVDTVIDAVDDEEAIEGFEEWHNYNADELDFAIDWPEDEKAEPVGTATKIWYGSDKIIREGDAKGEMNYYVHDFDAGKRPVVVKDDIMIVGKIDWNKRGLLN